MRAVFAREDPLVRAGDLRRRFRAPGARLAMARDCLPTCERVQEGRQILRRFMVRGHWRRPASNWKDRSIRWIRPYWKGPNMAAIIERTYTLKP
jgi:hypothetical protein